MPSQDALDNHQTASLSDVTLSALQLIQQPFGPAAPDSEAFADDTSLEQLADVKQALLSGDDLLLVLGEAGAGKSVLLQQLGINSGQSIQCFAVKGSSRFNALNLFAGMLEAFKHKPPKKLKDILDELIPCLQTMVARNTLSAIILDNADQISETELTQLLSGMLYINSQDETLMRVALAAQPEFEGRIPDLLPEGADLPYSSLTIEGMNSARAVEYLSLRLQQAGYDGELPFTEQEIDDIVAQSGGLPNGMHLAAAGVLNQLYDPLQHPLLQPLPEELQNSVEPSWLESRHAKLGLGAVAALCIVGGLLMFMPDAENGDDRYADSSGSTELLSSDSLNDSLASNDTTSRQAVASTYETEDDTPTRLVVEERKLVPFTSEAIESLVPEISQTANRPVANNSDTSTAQSQAVTTDSLDAEAQSASVNNLPEVDKLDDELESDLTLVAETQEDFSEQIALDTEVSANTSLDSVSDSDLLADASPQGETLESLAEETLTSENSAASNTDNPPSAALPTTSNNETLDIDPQLADILESPTWILVQNSSLITVQMSASRDRSSIESFLKRNRDVLPPPNSIYSFQRRGSTWYALLHGLYATFDEAQNAVEHMPASAVTDQPWIRSVGRVQDVLKAQ